MAKMRNCKACGKEIAKSAKVCPGCGAKQGGIGKIIGIVFVVLIVMGIIGSMAGGGSDSSKSDTGSTKTADVSEEVKEEEKIEYKKIKVEKLMNDLEENALSAADKYKGNYYAVTGKLSNIDAQGSYIDLVDPNDDWAVIGVQCYVKTDEVRDVVKKLSKGSTITVRGKMKDVGEVLGYSLDIDSIDQD